MKLYTLDEVVRECLIDMGDTNMNRYARMYNFAVGGLRELNMDISGQPTISILSINDNDTANLPPDFVSLIRIGICDGSGNIKALGMNGDMCLPRSADDCGNPVNCDDPTSTANNWGYVLGSIEGYADNFRNMECVGRMFGIGGGNNAYGSYRVDWQRNTINIGGLSNDGDCVIIEYLSDLSLIDGKYMIHPFIVESLKNWMRWKSIQHKGGNLGADQLAERQYYLAERQSKRRFNNHTIQEWLQAFRFANKAAPKF